VWFISLVIGQGAWQQLWQRRIERQFAFVDQLQHHVAEGGLGQRGAVHDRVGGQRLVRLGAPAAERGHLRDLAVVDDRHRHALHALALHEALNRRREFLVGARVAPSAGGGGAADQRQQENKHESGVHSWLPISG
jgi:hypothetical protein